MTCILHHRLAVLPFDYHPFVMSSLASVVSDDFVDDWKLQIAHTRHPFARFHTKYWGVEEGSSLYERYGDRRFYSR